MPFLIVSIQAETWILTGRNPNNPMSLHPRVLYEHTPKMKPNPTFWISFFFFWKIGSNSSPLQIRKNLICNSIFLALHKLDVVSHSQSVDLRVLDMCRRGSGTRSARKEATDHTIREEDSEPMILLVWDGPIFLLLGVNIYLSSYRDESIHT